MKKNPGRTSHLSQISKAYDVKFIPQAGANLNKLSTVQPVAVVFNGHYEPFYGRLSVIDGRANLKIKKDNDLVPAEQIRDELELSASV